MQIILLILPNTTGLSSLVFLYFYWKGGVDMHTFHKWFMNFTLKSFSAAMK